METVKHLQDYDTETCFAATLVSSERITPEESDEEVRELVLEIDRPEFEYMVGQSIGVVAPAAKAFGAEKHFRLYSVADLPEKKDSGRQLIKIAVRRCFYVDEYSGERYPGVASNYLCDLKAGDTLEIAGPFGLVFEVPRETNANLILIGSGTGIAPFRAYVKHIYHHVEDWHGRIWLFYGAKSGLELLYMNRWKDDFSQYYDREMFEAFRAVSPRPHWADPIAWDRAMEERSAELWKLFGLSNTYIYIAGLEPMLDELDKVFSKIAGSGELWQRRKAELRAGGRWVELVY